MYSITNGIERTNAGAFETPESETNPKAIADVDAACNRVWNLAAEAAALNPPANREAAEALLLQSIEMCKEYYPAQRYNLVKEGFTHSMAYGALGLVQIGREAVDRRALQERLVAQRPAAGTTAGQNITCKRISFFDQSPEGLKSPEKLTITNSKFEGANFVITVSYETIKGHRPQFSAIWAGGILESLPPKLPVRLMIDSKTAPEGEKEVVEEVLVFNPNDFSKKYTFVDPSERKQLGKLILEGVEEPEALGSLCYIYIMP